MSERVDLLEGLLKAVNRGLFGLAKDVLHRHAIPASGMAIMGQIVKIPGTTVSELARQTGFAKSHVSGTVESLSDLGFVDKRPDPRDQRLARVYPTQRAEEHFRQMQAAVRERLSSMISILPEEKVDAIIDGLQTLKAALEQERHIGDDRL